jgi:hypothetical protein
MSVIPYNPDSGNDLSTAEIASVSNLIKNIDSGAGTVLAKVGLI